MDQIFAILPAALAQSPKVIMPLLERHDSVEADVIIEALKTQVDKMLVE